MLRKSIVWRFFTVIVLLLGFFLVIGFVGQAFFFEQFYTRQKVNHMARELEQFANSFQQENWDNVELRNHITSFFHDTGSQIVISDREGARIYGEEYGFVVDIAGERLDVSLTNFIYGGQAEEIGQLDLRDGMTITMTGEKREGNFIPAQIQTDEHVTWTNAQPVQPTFHVRGTIVETSLPTEANISITTQVMMFGRAISSWLTTENVNQLTDQVTWVDYTDSVTGITNKLFVRPLINEAGQAEAIIFSMISLQPIGEAVEVVRTFYLYIIGILLLFSALFAFSLSKYLTRNFRKMSRVTQKMAKLDFSEKLEVTSEDEIGCLAENINQLSSNLRETIEELQVANELLQADIEKEKQLEETRKEFISGVSHELKTPLSIMKSYGEAVKDGVGTKNTAYYVDVVLQEAEKMNALVDDMLELAKLESGTYTLQKESFSMIDLIDDVNYKLMFKLQDKDMDVDVETEDDYAVLGDRRRMEQVLTNFITNGIRYGRPSSTVMIQLEQVKDRLKISVVNDGEPIPQEQLEKIWDRFYRADSARTRNTGGIGLGLSIVKNILELHETEFGVENREDGVAFYFYLPIVQA